ncbi:MAG: hypothetical protein ACK5ZD_06505, partial [Hyphomonadaceae bacterium]
MLKGKGRLSEDEAVGLYYRSLLQESLDQDRAEDMFENHIEGVLGKVKAVVEEPSGQLSPVYEGEERASRIIEIARGTIV